MTQNPPFVNSASLVQQAISGNRRALAKLLTIVEDGGIEGQDVLTQLFPSTGQAHIVGITGSPGSGKSTLVNRIACELRGQETKVGIVAIDPTSPFSGGALLGDRLRMRDLMTDPGIFIRSMASRGHSGGIAHATRGAIRVLDAAGFPIVLVETVGIGQAQVEIAQVAHTVVLVEAPGMGDEIQVLKAGMMEIADIIVVNKADRPEAQRTIQAIKSVYRQHIHSTSPGDAGFHTAWSVPIMQTSALNGHGVPALLDAIFLHLKYLRDSGQWQVLRESHIRAEVTTWFQYLAQVWLQDRLDKEKLETAVEAVVTGKRDPASAAQDLLASILGEKSKGL